MSDRFYNLEDAPDNYTLDEQVAYINGANWGRDCEQAEIERLKLQRDRLLNSLKDMVTTAESQDGLDEQESMSVRALIAEIEAGK